MVHLRAVALVTFLAAMVTASLAQPPFGGRSGRAGRANTVLDSGQLPDLKGFTAEGEPIELRQYIKGSYTVLAPGCLTCPIFHRSYREIEAANADYAPLGVKFYFVYQSLRHPELGGYVQAQNQQERLLQLAEARQKLQTKTPWLADTIDDSIRIGLKAQANSVYLISPEGKLLFAANWLRGAELRAALEKQIGKVPTPTSPNDLDLPRLARNRPQNVDSQTRVKRPDGLVILKTTPANPFDTYFVKLRAEASPELMNTGSGRLFLGFYPDPIHGAFWNNLNDPMKYELQLPEGVAATPITATAQPGPGEKDSQPRQFWVDIESDGPPEDIRLSLHYYACTATQCVATTHEYTLSFTPDDRNSRTFGFNRGQRGRGGQRGLGGQRGRGERGEFRRRRPAR